MDTKIPPEWICYKFELQFKENYSPFIIIKAVINTDAPSEVLCLANPPPSFDL